MLRKLTVLFALLSLAVAGACGDEPDNNNSNDSASGEQLSKAEFIEQGDAICGEFEAAASQIETPTDEADLARYLKDVRAPAEAARESWELLQPPEDGEQVHQALLDQLTTGLDALNGAISAAEAGDTVTAEDLLSEADRAGDPVDAQVEAYGFQKCGKDEADQGEGPEGGESGGDGTADMQPLPEEDDPEPNDPPRDDEPLPEEPDPAPVDDPPAEDQPGDPQP